MFARTPRLLLRPGWMEDAPALAEAIGEPAILRNLTSAPAPYGEADAQEFLTRVQDPRLPSLLAFSRTMGALRLIGGCGIHLEKDGEPELGYWIARRYWGLGFATEAARAVLNMARAAGVREVRAAHFADNPASGNVLRKLGFRYSGHVEQRYSAARGTLAECLIFEQAAGGPVVADAAMGVYADLMPAMAA